MDVTTLTAIPVPAPSIVLAIALFADVLLSLKPARYIAECLEAVHLDRRWWWVLTFVKVLAIVGLVAGLYLPGIGIATTVGVFAYFVAACIAHVRARFFNPLYWVSCLGMTSASLVVLLLDLMLKA